MMGGYGGRVDDEQATAIQDAGLRGMEHLMLQLSHAGGTGTESSSPPAPAAAERPQQRQQLVEQMQIQRHQQQQVDCREMTADMTVSKLKKAMSILNRTGHARFRRGPVVAQSSQSPDAPEPESSTWSVPAPVAPRLVTTLDFTKSVSGYEYSLSGAATSSFLSSDVTTTGADGSVSNGRVGGGGSSSLVLPPPPPPLPSSSSGGAAQAQQQHKRNKCHDDHAHAHSENVAGGKYGGRCHCSKRKNRVKRTVRVPAISAKVADIPADDYSWRKYGQKPIKGSPYPRGYYKCSTVRGCPARKHVERDPAEPSMLIVTYEGDHRHSPATDDQDPPPPLPELPPSH